MGFLGCEADETSLTEKSGISFNRLLPTISVRQTRVAVPGLQKGVHARNVKRHANSSSMRRPLTSSYARFLWPANPGCS